MLIILLQFLIWWWWCDGDRTANIFHFIKFLCGDNRRHIFFFFFFFFVHQSYRADMLWCNNNCRCPGHYRRQYIRDVRVMYGLTRLHNCPRLMLGMLTSLGDVQRGVAPVHLLWFLPPPPHLYVCGCPRFPDRLTRPRLLMLLLLLCCFSCICPPKLKVSLSTSSLEYHLKAICYCPLHCPIAYWLPSLLLTVHCCRRE